MRGGKGAPRRLPWLCVARCARTTSRRFSRVATWRRPSRAREIFAPYPPSSPSIAILKDGKLVYMMERRDIEIERGRRDRGPS